MEWVVLTWIRPFSSETICFTCCHTSGWSNWTCWGCSPASTATTASPSAGWRSSKAGWRTSKLSSSPASILPSQPCQSEGWEWEHSNSSRLQPASLQLVGLQPRAVWRWKVKSTKCWFSKSVPELQQSKLVPSTGPQLLRRRPLELSQRVLSAATESARETERRVTAADQSSAGIDQERTSATQATAKHQQPICCSSCFTGTAATAATVVANAGGASAAICSWIGSFKPRGRWREAVVEVEDEDEQVEDDMRGVLRQGDRLALQCPGLRGM